MDIKREMQLSLRSGEDDGTPHIIWKCTGMEPALCYQQSENIKCFIAGYLPALAAESICRGLSRFLVLPSSGCCQTQRRTSHPDRCLRARSISERTSVFRPLLTPFHALAFEQTLVRLAWLLEGQADPGPTPFWARFRRGRNIPCAIRSARRSSSKSRVRWSRAATFLCSAMISSEVSLRFLRIRRKTATPTVSMASPNVSSASSIRSLYF